MHVTELAGRANVPSHIVRYYTQVGLLKPRRDSRNGYRLYAESDVYRVRFIRRAKSLGFTLRDVKIILRDADRGVAPCPEVRHIIRLRARENREHLADLDSLQQRVEAAIARWDTMPDRPPNHEHLCHLIDTIAAELGDLT